MEMMTCISRNDSVVQCHIRCVYCVFYCVMDCVGDGGRESEIGDNVVGQFNPIADQHKQCTITTWVSVVGFA